MLYDLVFDPREMHNLADDAACQSVLEDMRNRLVRWMKQTDDPVLPDGHVAPPSGAQFNDPDAQSPKDRVITVV